ncbi:GON-4-like protein isoform X1 [Schistocerca serialis cubense]|uniref:GON-4-like protein isoform X1 n=1 Tax=Schistocerca serialis cubense TaxID=2023355 RepID=UPI00214EB307|nr:GON-4-like protein isoform X1 [Schistocerca serialis cubense]
MSRQNSGNVNSVYEEQGSKGWEGNDDAGSESSCDSCDLKIDIPENEVSDVKQSGRKRKYQDIEPDEEMMAVISGMEEEIERQLDAKAAKSHLTATNVKNILKTIITDEHVLGMVRQALLGKCDSLDIPYEPKITRAKAKQMQGSQPTSAIGTPVKRQATSKCRVLIEQELPEDSSDDEEYQPTDDQEQSDDDKEMETTKESNDDSIKSGGEDTEGEDEEIVEEEEEDVDEEEEAEDEEEAEEESEKESDSGSESENESGSDSEEGEENKDNTTEVHHKGLEIDSDEELESESEESSSSGSDEETDSECDTGGDKDVTQNKVDDCEESRADMTPTKELNDKQLSTEINSHKVPVDTVHVNDSDNTCSKSERSPHVSFLLPDEHHSEMHLTDDCSNLSAKDSLGGIGKESIGQRTRSKLSLSDTPLEAIERAFIPPDITTDMYDSECDDEDWKNFLKGFTEPLLPDMNNTVDDDEDADPEYNILADVEEAEMEEEKEDKKEECRIDRAVKVSKKEVNALVKELFKMAGFLSSSDDEDDDSKKITNNQVQQPAKENETNSEQVSLTSEQRLLLDQQMREHVQFTTQNYLQTFCHPKYNVYAAECKGYLVNLSYLSGNNPKSAFYAGNLKEALALIEDWEKYFSSENRRRDLTRFIQTQINKRLWLKNVKKKAYLSMCEFPAKMMEIVSNSKVFMYPLLLPPQPFRCDGPARPCFVRGEEQLLVIGLEQFMDYAQKNPEYFPKKLTYCNVTPYISKLMMPPKEPRQLYLYIYKHANEHPFKHYFEHQKAPGTIHYVLPYASNTIKAPKDHPKDLLPEIWLRYIHPKEQKM